MKTFQIIFAIYMIWMLAIFVPAHKRGMITMGPREADRCCEVVKVVVTCCEEEALGEEARSAQAKHKEHSREPTQRDIANCAVCFWSAGVLPITFADIDLRPAGIVALSNYFCESALIQAMLAHNALPRGPPRLI